MATITTAAAAQSITRPSEVTRIRLMRRLFGKAEYAFTVLALLVLSNAVIPLLRPLLGLPAVTAEGDSLTRALLAPIYLVAAVWAIVHCVSAARAVARHPWPVILSVLAVISTTWSAAPDLTLRRGVALCATTLVGVYLASRFDLVLLIRLLAWSLGLAAVLSLLVCVLWPSLGVTPPGPYAGAWHGIFENKNTLGRAMALAVITFAVLRSGQEPRRRLVLAGFGLSGLLVVLSRSLTALVAAVVLLILSRLYRGLRLSASAGMLVAILALLLGGAVGIWSAAEADAILRALGRDDTLTGRTLLWGLVAMRMRDRPWLGYGFSAFWTGLNDAAAGVMEQLRWWTPHAHNGFLELTLELGLVGFGVFLMGYVVALVRALKAVRSAEGVPAMWPITFLTFTFLYNLTENTLLNQGNIFWTLYVATVCSPLQRQPRAGTPARTRGHASRARADRAVRHIGRAARMR